MKPSKEKPTNLHCLWATPFMNFRNFKLKREGKIANSKCEISRKLCKNIKFGRATQNDLELAGSSFFHFFIASLLHSPNINAAYEVYKKYVNEKKTEKEMKCLQKRNEKNPR